MLNGNGDGIGAGFVKGAMHDLLARQDAAERYVDEVGSVVELFRLALPGVVQGNPEFTASEMAGFAMQIAQEGVREIQEYAKVLRKKYGV